MTKTPANKAMNGMLFSCLAGASAFGAYTCMYAFRKAFTAGTYAGYQFAGVDYKIVLVLMQVFGYMISKFVGVTFISGIAPARRAGAILILIGIAWLALLAFALLKPPYNALFLFFNGLPLGMIWGLVFGFLEGRRNTELMAAIMSTSLVFASGFVKTVGRYLMKEMGVPEFWMPFVTGLLFALPMALFVWGLSRLPKPDEQDIAERAERKPMSRTDRVNVLAQYGFGLFFVVITYLLLTVARDIRDNFEVEIWAALGYGGQPAIFTQIDAPVALSVLAIMAMLISVKNNLKAFMLIHGIVIVGCLLILISVTLYQAGLINAIAWMSTTALGMYMGFVAYNSIYFERMIASFKIAGNVGFVMYLADATGYTGSVSVLLYKHFGSGNISWLSFYKEVLFLVAVAGMATAGISMIYFFRKHRAVNNLKMVAA